MKQWQIANFNQMESFYIDNLLSILEKLPIPNGNIGDKNKKIDTQ
jgi:hypothetical protein